MTDRPRTTNDDRTRDDPADRFGRREFVALGAGASATMLAGCAGGGSSGSPDGSDGSGGSDGTDDADVTTGSFRLLISDAPADIADFDRLDVTLDEARVFQSGSEGEDDDTEDDGETADSDDESGSTGNETDTEDDSTNETDTEDDSTNETDTEDSDDEEAESEDEEADDEDSRGYTVVDLDGATVDLTQVIEDDAIAVFDGEIPAGSYEKIELEVTDVQGIVDGSEVDVKLPSEKLQITNGFEVTPDESVSFVFDINVVKRGPNNGYILKPVISGSGVAGRDVEVNEIDDEGEDDDSEDEEAETEDDESSDDDADDTDDGGSDDGAGNETAGDGNETAGDGS